MADTKTLLRLLEAHYLKTTKPMEYAGGLFVPECGVNGGMGSGSRADALYVGFTSASGRLLVGHEIKVSRADWRRELAKIGKADFWADSCHAWYIVTTGPDIAPVEELPPGWGLMYPVRGRLKVVVKAKVDEDRQPAWDAVRSIMARLDTLQRTAMLAFQRETHEEAYADLEERAAARAAARVTTEMTREDRDRLDRYAKLEELLGTEILDWAYDGKGITTEQAAAALQLVRDGANLADQRLFGEDSLRKAGQRLLDGLTAFQEARTALLDLTGGGGRG